jgi:type II secretory pathway pseudopilin PulG
VLSFFTIGMTAIPAVICGHLALGSIRRSGGLRTGGGLAIAGLACGYFGFIFLIALMAGITAPVIIRQRQKADQTEAVSNARSFGFAMFEFQTEYGKYPDDETAAMVASATGTTQVTGTSSNARFRQLIRAGISGSETPYYAKSRGTHRPDGVLNDDNAIGKGECGFAYFGNILTTDGVARPVAMAPFAPGTTKPDPDVYGGKVVILWSDSSVTSMNVGRATGRVIKDGKDLLDPSHPIWGGKPPVIAYPE